MTREKGEQSEMETVRDRGITGGWGGVGGAQQRRHCYEVSEEEAEEDVRLKATVLFGLCLH